MATPCGAVGGGDDAFGIREIKAFEPRQWHDGVKPGDANDRGDQRCQRLLGNARGDLAAEPGGQRRFMDNDAAAGFFDRGEDCGRVERLQGRDINDLGADVAPGQRIGGGEHLRYHAAPGHERDVGALAQDKAAIERRGDPVIDNLFARGAIEPGWFEKDDGIGIPDRGQQQTIGAPGEEGRTTRKPGICANIASGLSEWCSGARMPPPHGERSTIGQLNRPRVRVRSRAAWFAS